LLISVNLLILSGIRRICQNCGSSRSLYLSVRRVVVIIVAYHVCQLLTKLYPAQCSQGLLPMQGNISVDFDATGQLLVIYSAFIKYLIEIGKTVNQCSSYL
jgi:hypothetical protein